VRTAPGRLRFARACCASSTTRSAIFRPPSSNIESDPLSWSGFGDEHDERARSELEAERQRMSGKPID
jgi:hypothetical protein